MVLRTGSPCAAGKADTSTAPCGDQRALHVDAEGTSMRRKVAFASVLCPVDFSTHSREAIRHAGAMARKSGGRLVVSYVNDPLLLTVVGRGPAGRRQFVQRTRAELARFVNRSLGVRHGREIALSVSTGNPVDEILRSAKSLRSDLIVIGTQGLSGFQKLFFGSTTEQVLRRATIPVLAIPASQHRRGAKAPPLVVRRVITPVDLAGEWQADAIRAADVAASFEAELILVHVLAPIQSPPWLRSADA